MGGRPKHSKKHIEKFLKELEAADWVVERKARAGHFKAKCPCGDHWFTVASTPSSRDYLKNRRAHASRSTCWDGEE